MSLSVFPRVWRMKANPLTAHAWIENARRLLDEGGGIESQPGDGLETSLDRYENALSAQLLIAHVLGRPRSWLIAHPDVVLSDSQHDQADGLLNRLRGGEPLPYLLGHWEFYGLDFIVTPAVLIPRPETELLVEQAIAWLKAHPGRRTAADVGTGSGCIAVSAAKHVPDVHFLAVDRSAEALAVAESNAERLGVSGQIQFLRGDLLTGAHGSFDLVCANLPYIPHSALRDLDVARFEPHQALDGGPDGLDAIRALAADAPRWLAPGGCLLLEIQFDQGNAVADLVRRHLPGAQVAVLRDLAGRDRVVRGQVDGG